MLFSRIRRRRCSNLPRPPRQHTPRSHKCIVVRQKRQHRRRDEHRRAHVSMDRIWRIMRRSCCSVDVAVARCALGRSGSTLFVWFRTLNSERANTPKRSAHLHCILFPFAASRSRRQQTAVDSRALSPAKLSLVLPERTHVLHDVLSAVESLNLRVH